MNRWQYWALALALLLPGCTDNSAAGFGRGPRADASSGGSSGSDAGIDLSGLGSLDSDNDGKSDLDEIRDGG
ncbi:MAG: hypothetical protein JKY56_17505, partial [Kofleriaceae bacterium]|nr:hypothetical protein [Kofleriaceae bacterium]